MDIWIYWLILAIVLTIVEILTTNIVTIWFIASAILAMILSLFTDSILIQIGTFVIIGVVLLILTKPIINKYLKKDSVKTNLDRVVGMTGIVTEEIRKNVVGEVKVDGKRWSAIANRKIAVGETVKILNIEGVKLLVKKESEE